MNKITRSHSNARMSKIVVHGGLVYLSGQTCSGIDLEGIEAQTREVLARIDTLLDEAGSGREKLLSVLIHLKSMEDFAAMNQIWEDWLPCATAPARTTVQANLQTRLCLWK